MRPVVSVQKPAGTGTASVRHLRAGQSLRFGACGCGTCGFDLTVPAQTAGAVVGTVAARADHWRLDNLGPVPLAVDDLESAQNLIMVPPGRTGVVVPFELARIAAVRAPLLIVFGPEPSGLPPVRPCPGAPDPTPPIDRHTIYFAVLVSLCEPLLRAPSGAALPTSAEIARDLRRRGIPVTARAVDWHIEYLVDKLGLRPDRPGRARRSWRKEALAAAALRLALVGTEHLGVGAARRPGAGPAAGTGGPVSPHLWPARRPGDTVRG